MEPTKRHLQSLRKYYGLIRLFIHVHARRAACRLPEPAVAEAPVTVWQGNERLVLVDGYRRVAALRRLGRDTARVECWSCDLSEALLGVLARAQNRPFAAIEVALQLRELTQGLGLSQHEVARRCGRDVSW